MDNFYKTNNNYVFSPTDPIDPYPYLLPACKLTNLEKHNFFWLYCLTFNTSDIPWNYYCQLGLLWHAKEQSSLELFCKTFYELYPNKTHKFNSNCINNNCENCLLNKNRECETITKNYSLILSKNNNLSIKYAENMFYFWADPAKYWEIIMKLCKETKLFPTQINIPNIFTSFRPIPHNLILKYFSCSNQILDMKQKIKFAGDIFNQSQKYQSVQEAFSKSIDTQVKPYPNLTNNTTTLDVYKLVWHYVSQMPISECLWKWDWRMQFGINKTVKIGDLFCACETEKIGEINSCNGCPLHHYPNCSEIMELYSFLIKTGNSNLISELADIMKNFWDDPSKSRYLLAKFIGRAEILTAFIIKTGNIHSSIPVTSSSTFTSNIPSAEDNLDINDQF